MAEVIRNIFKVYVDIDWKVTDTIPAPIAAFGNGQTTIRIVSAEANPTQYTGGLNFILASGQTLDERQPMFENGQEEVNGEQWFVWDFPLTRFITSNSSKNADGTLFFTSVFKSISDTNNEYPQVPQSEATISASSQSVTEILEDDVVQTLSGQINDRLKKDSTGLTDIDNDNVNLMPFYDADTGLQTKQTKVDFIQDVVDEIGETTGVIAYPTDGLAGITSPLTGNPVTRTVDDVNDEDFDKDNSTEISHVIQVTGVWETAFESVYPIGFLTGEYTSLVFTQNIFAKKLGASIDLRTSYYIYDAINGLRIIGSGPSTFAGAVITVNTDTYSANSKQNVINELSVDPGIGERVYTVTEVRGTAGDTGFAQIEDGVSTFSTWQLPTGGALAGLIRKVPSPVEDNITSQTADGSLKDGGITIGDIMQKSVELPLLQLRSEKGNANGYAGIEADGFISNSILPQSLKRWLGTFGTAGSDTGGDLPTVGVSVGDTYECIIDAFVSAVAGITFDNGDFATFNGTGWSKTDNTEAVKSVNGKTGIITIVSTDLSDMPSSFPAGTMGDHLIVNDAETGYELVVANNNTSTGIVSGMQLTKGTGETLTIASGIYKFVDYSNPNKPKTNTIIYGGESNIAIPTLTTGYISHISIDENETVIFRLGHLSGSQRRTECFLGLVGHLDKLTVTNVQSTPVVNNQPVNTSFDLVNKPFIARGILFTGVSGQAQIQHSAGTMVGIGINADIDLTNPNERDFSQDSPVTFTEIWRDGSGGITLQTNTNFDADLYDNGTGTLATIPGGNDAVNHRIYFGTNDQVFIIRGQQVHNTVSDAVIARTDGSDVLVGIPEEIFEHSVLRCILTLEKGTIDFSDTADAIFYVPVLGILGGGGSVASVDDTNVNNTSIVGDLSGKANAKLVHEMLEYKAITFSEIKQFTIEDEITTAKAQLNTNTVLKPFQIFEIQVPTFVSTNPIELSFDGGPTHSPLVDDELNAIGGTTGADAKMRVFWNGASIVLVRKETIFTTTILVADWVGSSPATATKAVVGILEADNPTQDLDLSSVAFIDIEDTETEYHKIYLGITTNDQVVFSAKETPTKDLIITLKVGGR